MPTERDFLAALAGAGQGLTMDFGDELYGLGGGLNSAMYGADPIAGYKAARDKARVELKKLEQESPNAYMAGDLASAFVPGTGQASVAMKASKPLLKRALQMALMGGAGGLGRSEADNAGDLAKDTLSSAAMSAGTGVAMDQFMRRIGDVIDFKKMRDKRKKEKVLKDTPSKDPRLTEGDWNKLDKEVDQINDEIDILNPSDPDYNQMLDKRIARLKEIESLADSSIAAKKGGKLSGDLGKLDAKTRAENNRRAMKEAGFDIDKEMRDAGFDDPYEPPQITRQTEGNVKTFPKTNKQLELESDADSFAKGRVESGDWDSYEDAKNWYLKYWGPEAVEKRAKSRTKKKANDQLEKEFHEDFKGRIGWPTQEKQWPYRAYPEGSGKNGLRVVEPMDWETYARAVEAGKTNRHVLEAFPDARQGDSMELEKYRLFRDLAQNADRQEALEAISQDLKKGKYKDIKNRAQVKKRVDEWRKKIKKNLMQGTTLNQGRRDWEWNPEE